MKTINEINSSEELLAYKKVLAKCTGNITLNGRLVKILNSVNDNARTLPIKDLTISCESIISVKGKYVYINIRAYESEEVSFVRLHKSSYRADKEALIIDLLCNESDTAYTLTIVQPIAVYRDEDGLVIVGEFKNMLYNMEEVDVVSAYDEVMYELEEEFMKEDEEEDILLKQELN